MAQLHIKVLVPAKCIQYVMPEECWNRLPQSSHKYRKAFLCTPKYVRRSTKAYKTAAGVERSEG